MKNKCSTPYCKNDRAPNRKICHKCKSQREKVLNPIFYYYNNLRNNAKRRGKEFTLTRDEFEQFCKETNYIELKGKSTKSMTIDRKNADKGYSYDNIQILTQKLNGLKGVFEKQNKPCPF